MDEFLLCLFQVRRRDRIEDVPRKIELKVQRSFSDEFQMFGKPVKRYMDVGSDHFFVSADAFFSDFSSFGDSFFAGASDFSFFSPLSFVSFLPFPA